MKIIESSKRQAISMLNIYVDAIALFYRQYYFAAGVTRQRQRRRQYHQPGTATPTGYRSGQCYFGRRVIAIDFHRYSL